MCIALMPTVAPVLPMRPGTKRHQMYRLTHRFARSSTTSRADDRVALTKAMPTSWNTRLTGMLISPSTSPSMNTPAKRRQNPA